MSDGLPSDDQMRRIERGVLDRIDARRATRNRVIGAATAIVLVGGGGFGLLSSVVRSSGSSNTATAGGAAAGPTVVVRCALGAGSDSSGARRVQVPEASLPSGAVAACTGGASEFQSGSKAAPEQAGGNRGDLSTASPSALPRGVLCTDVDGSLVVLPLKGTASATCVTAGMEPYTR